MTDLIFKGQHRTEFSQGYDISPMKSKSELFDLFCMTFYTWVGYLDSLFRSITVKVYYLRFYPKWLLIRPNGDFVKGLITSRLYYQGCSILWLFIYGVYIFRYFGKFITETFVFCSKLRKKLSSFLWFQVRLFLATELVQGFMGICL